MKRIPVFFAVSIALWMISAGAASAACTPDATTLCLNDSRFQVRVAWVAVHQGTSGDGQAVALTSDTGYFWFFNSSNVELVLKVLDGRPVNGHFWVFFGALTNVQFTLTVTDTQTGVVKTYFNPQDTQASISDTAAFVDNPPATPTANFTFSPASPAAGAAVSFTDASTGSPTSWLWDFGDPGSGAADTSAQQNPSHTYAAAGSYTATLTVANAAGTSAPHTATVVVGAPAIQTIEVTLQQFTYSPSVITLHAGQSYQLVLHALDSGAGSGHGFSGVPSLGIAAESNIMPGSDVTTATITPTSAQVGNYPFHCTIFCGGGHSGMTGTIEVVQP
jgi:PKD repeat protein